mgnify:CR=1 FL=1
MRKLRNITKPGSSLYICVGEGVLRDFTLDFTVSNVQRRTKCRIFTRMTKFFVLFCKKGLTAQRFCGILIKLEIGITIQYLGVAQLVARYLGVVEAAGSSPVTQTISSVHKGFDFMNTRFFILIRFYVRSRFSPAPFVMPFSARLNTWSRHLFWYRRRYSVCVISRVSPHIRQSDNR